MSTLVVKSLMKYEKPNVDIVLKDKKIIKLLLMSSAIFNVKRSPNACSCDKI